MFCCDRKSRAACAQSFTLWQQATIEITRCDHSIIACPRHLYRCCSSRTSRSGAQPGGGIWGFVPPRNFQNIPQHIGNNFTNTQNPLLTNERYNTQDQAFLVFLSSWGFLVLPSVFQSPLKKRHEPKKNLVRKRTSKSLVSVFCCGRNSKPEFGQPGSGKWKGIKSLKFENCIQIESLAFKRWRTYLSVTRNKRKFRDRQNVTKKVWKSDKNCEMSLHRDVLRTLGEVGVINISSLRLKISFLNRYNNQHLQFCG